VGTTRDTSASVLPTGRPSTAKAHARYESLHPHLQSTDCSQSGWGYAICCPEKGAPTTCLWRGGTAGASDCNGQCHEGEIRAPLGDHNGLNSWGGFPREGGTDTKQCNRGGKAFCCASGMFDSVLAQCTTRRR
jgi:hypothetical protein